MKTGYCHHTGIGWKCTVVRAFIDHGLLYYVVLAMVFFHLMNLGSCLFLMCKVYYIKMSLLKSKCTCVFSLEKLFSNQKGKNYPERRLFH